MTTRRYCLAVLAVMSIGIAGCASGFSATYDSDPAHDFSGQRSWAWISSHPMTVGTTTRMPNPLLEPRLMEAIEIVLARKGMTKVDRAEAADLVVAFSIGSREEISVDTYPTMYRGYNYPRRWGGAYYGTAYATETQVRQYEKGMLAIDIFDVKKRAPVWHGVATKSITESDRKKMEETVDAAVAAVLENFPPG